MENLIRMSTSRGKGSARKVVLYLWLGHYLLYALVFFWFYLNGAL